MTLNEKRFYVMSHSGEQKHGPYLEKAQAIRDTAREQLETLEEHHVKIEYVYP